MQTAKQWGAAENRPERFVAALGKLLAIGIILVPLVMLLFPELNHRSGTTIHGRQNVPTARAQTPNHALIPFFQKETRDEGR